MGKPLFITILVGGIVTALLVTVAWRNVIRQENQVFTFEAEFIEDAVTESVKASVAAAQSLQALFHSSEQVDAEELRIFSEDIFSHYAFIDFIQYCPLISFQERREFEEEQQYWGFMGFQVFEYDDERARHPADVRETYCPVLYVEPFSPENASLIGYDILSSPDFQKSIRKAFETGVPTSSYPVARPAADFPRKYYLFSPVYEGKQWPETPVNRLQRANGLIVLTIVPSVIFDNRDFPQSLTIELEMLPLEAKEEAVKVLQIVPSSPANTAWSPIITLSKELMIHISAQRFRLIISKPLSFQHITLWPIWAASVAGLAFSAGMFIILSERSKLRKELVERKRAEAELRRYQTHLEDLVQQRTQELSHAKDAAEAARQTAESARRTAESARHKAEDANRAKSTFLANMSHELRTPLNAILGFSQLMTREPSLNDNQRENLSVINRSGEHLLMLINDILEMSRIEAGQSDVHIDTLDLTRTLDTIEEMLRLRAEQKGISLIVERMPALPRSIRTDERKLRQILINLLSNAVKFTEEGSVELKIVQLRRPESVEGKIEDWNNATPYKQSSISQSVSGQTSILQFSIKDTGIGIAPDKLDHIFDPFVQADDTRKSAEGTGLGLAISRQFVKLMGGELTAVSQPGEGSVFTFTIPVEVIDAAQTDQQQAPCRVIGLAPNQRASDGCPYRILIAEDQEFSRLLLRQLLETIDSDEQQNPIPIFEIRTAVNGQEAVEVARQWQPHLIFMDIRMPVLNGYAATREIRAFEAVQADDKREQSSGLPTGLNPQIIIIALTASAFEEDRQKVMAAGCNDFLRKPFQESEIFETLATHLGVLFVYEAEDREQEARNRGQGTEKNSLTPEALAALPADVLNALEQATVQVNIKLVDAAIASVRLHNVFVAEALANWAHDFRYQDIWNLIQQTKSG